MQFSTGEANDTTHEERCTPLKLKTEMETMTMGTMNFGNSIFENSQDTITKISKSIQKHNILPELEIFDCGMCESIDKYVKMQLIPKKYHCNFVLGVPGGMSGSIENLIYLKKLIDPKQTWTVSGIGKNQLSLCTHAIALGGHVRVGIEDNIYFKKGEYAKSNAQVVERITRIASELDRPIATPDQARKILGLKKNTGGTV